jgi:mRNA-degrading endonuclease RelE of RelBE toxin-antitoxin system
MVDYRLIYSDTSRNQIVKLHPEIKSIIQKKLDTLQREPFIGKRLERELSGYLSFRARRFRIIYKLNDAAKHIEIHYVGHRKDVYELFAERADRSISP